MKAIFLDLDGVLNCEAQWMHPYTLDQNCIKNFCAFAKKYKGDIILVSSWRIGWESLKKETQSPQINNLEKCLSPYGIRIKDKTPNYKKTRFELISYYLKRHPYDDYIIIDDDESEYPEGKPERLYLVNAKCGFTETDVKKCLKF